MGEKIKYMNNGHKDQHGFSLIELAIVIIISGVLLAAAVTAYKQYTEKQRIISTQARVETITQAMDRFLATYGHYPCPASFSAAPGSANFGAATNCYNDTTVASGGCGDENGDAVDDYCVTRVFKDHDGLPGTPDVAFRIRKGSLPFRALKEGIGWDADETTFTGPLPYGIRAGSQIKKYQRTVDIGAEDTVDTYKNRLTYVLTEVQGTEDFLPRFGAIDIIDEHHTVANPRYLSQNADYVLVSHGQDGSGARGFYGDVQAGGCPASLPKNERENCDGDNVYVSSLRYDAQGTEKYDDMLFYRSWVSYYLWDLSDTNDKNIHNLNTGNVGIGAKNPKEKMHVYEGNVLADSAAIFKDSVTGAIIKPAGSVMADKYCGYDASDGVDCFLPEKIGGTGMDCDNLADDYSGSVQTGLKAMQGIQSQKLHCRKFYDTSHSTSCPGGGFVTSVKYDFTTKRLVITGCRPPPP